MTIDVKNLILITATLVVVAFIGLYIPYKQYQKGQQNIKQPAAANGGPVVTILYANKGFEPSTINVKIGATVEWINTSDKLMWIASDPHPSHTNLPGFDQQGIESNVDAGTQGLMPSAYAHSGQTEYRYKFLKTGKWDYHNHLVPFDRGTIIVE